MMSDSLVYSIRQILRHLPQNQCLVGYLFVVREMLENNPDRSNRFVSRNFPNGDHH